MVPALYDGDVVLVKWGAGIRPDDIALVRWASRPDQLSVKRVSHPVDDDHWFVTSDNPHGSTDSKDLGPAETVARVVARLWPRPKLIL